MVCWRSVANHSWYREGKREMAEREKAAFFSLIPFCCFIFFNTDLRCDFHIISSISHHHQPSEGNNFLLSNFVTVLEEKWNQHFSALSNLESAHGTVHHLPPSTSGYSLFFLWGLSHLPWKILELCYFLSFFLFLFFEYPICSSVIRRVGSFDGFK